MAPSEKPRLRISAVFPWRFMWTIWSPLGSSSTMPVPTTCPSSSVPSSRLMIGISPTILVLRSAAIVEYPPRSDSDYGVLDFLVLVNICLATVTVVGDLVVLTIWAIGGDKRLPMLQDLDEPDNIDLEDGLLELR